MAEFERVPLRPRPKRDWLPGAAIAFVAFVALAILKPWQPQGLGGGLDGPSALPTFFVRPTERTGPRPYDPILFGGREPDPAWELWPAGYVVEFGMSGPVKVREPVGGSPGPGGSASPAPSAGESAVPTAAASSHGPAASPPPSRAPGPSAAPTAEPAEDGFFDLGTTDHLVALGINSPADVQIATVTLSRLSDDRLTPIAIVELPTLWESNHFIVIAPADSAAPGQASQWEPGLYRLVLTTAFGEVRSIDLRVRPELE